MNNCNKHCMCILGLLLLGVVRNLETMDAISITLLANISMSGFLFQKVTYSLEYLNLTHRVHITKRLHLKLFVVDLT